MSSMKQDRRYLAQYWTYLKKYKLLLTLGFIIIPILSFVQIIQPVLIKHGIDNNILKGDIPGLYQTVGLFGICVVVEFISKSLQGFLFQYIGQKTVTEIRSDLFNHVLQFSSSYFDKTPIGTITSRLTSDIESLNDSFASGLVTLFGDLLTLIGILVAMFILSPKLTMVTLLVIPPLFIAVNFFRIKLRNFYNLIRTTQGKITAYLQEQLQGVHIVQLFQRKNKNFQEFDVLNKKYRYATISSLFYDGLLYSFVESMSSIMIAVIIWYGWGQHLNAGLTIGILVAFIEYIHKFFTPLKELSTKFAILQQALAALEKIFGLFDVQDTIRSGTLKLDSFRDKIQFKQLNYAYPGHESKPVLKNINLDIKKGEIVALVGPTGSGKTTVARLLTRLYPNYSGSISIDGQELDQLKLSDLRRHIAVVSQDVQLFNDTIAFNITLGNPKITYEKMIESSMAVQLHPFISGLDHSYDTKLGQGAKTLSAGQAQLISFARALAADTPIILLDEATASVDSLSEKLIQKAVEELLKEKTVLVIAHRLSTIQKASKIVALKHGEIIESGNHETLMAKHGFYANLFNMQFASL